jgi:hypothetical protein
MASKVANAVQGIGQAGEGRKAETPQGEVHRAVVEDAKSYDRATELEMAGATMLDLKPTEWCDLTLAA